MSSKSYAEKNAGRRIRVHVSGSGPNRAKVKYPFCRCVGYDSDNPERIYVEFEDPVLHAHGNNPAMLHTFIRTADNKHAPTVWSIPYEHVRFLRKLNKKELPKVISPYPHKCTNCNSPARKCASYILCSNTQCKANKKFKKAILSKLPKMNKLRCPTCNDFAVEVSAVRDKNKQSKWRFSCAKKHMWKHEPAVNDVVKYSSRNASNKDMIWRDNQWQEMK